MLRRKRQEPCHCINQVTTSPSWTLRRPPGAGPWHYGLVDHASEAHGQESLNRSAFSATTHCLTGCAIGEVLGMILATWWGWGNFASIALAIVLAFFFG